MNLDELGWSGWGSPSPVANGIVHDNDCDPSCAEGTVTDYPATLQPTTIKRCRTSKGALRFYTRFTVQYTLPEDNPRDAPAGPTSPSTFNASCPSPGFRVFTGSKAARFGAFTESGEYDASYLETLYGKPARSRLGKYSSCVKRWPKFGMAARFNTYGSEDGDPCEVGIFRSASLTGRRWHTVDGVHPGGSAATAAKAARRRCSRRVCGGKSGYALALHRSECAAGRFAGVIAQTRGRRVTRLIVNTYSCE